MAGLASVASALNANDPGLARIAAVHLRIPNLPSLAARLAQNDTPAQGSDALHTIRNESSIRPSLEDVHENPSLIIPATEKENRQVDAVVAKLKLTDDQRQQLHRALSKLGGVSTYHEVLEIAKDMFE